MNHIVVSFQYFTRYQNILVYQNNECVEKVEVSVDRTIDVIQGLCDKYNITDITLCGNIDYLNQFKKEIQKQVNFKNRELNINIVNN